MGVNGLKARGRTRVKMFEVIPYSMFIHYSHFYYIVQACIAKQNERFLKIWCPQDWR